MQPLGGFRYGGDVSGYSGITAELKIVNTSGAVQTGLVVDDIGFSAQAIPEPSTWSLWLLSILVLWPCYARTRKNPLWRSKDE